jgi:uncharacterized membrane protein YeaQ/YmgE (transglycosylase-associated protein family)
MFHYAWMFVIGIVVGVVARFLLPGAQHMGILWTGVLGVAGSFLGGFLARLFSRPPPGSRFHPAGFILSVACSMALLFVWFHFNLGARLGIH